MKTIKNCVVCGKEFEAIYKKRQTCSERCWYALKANYIGVVQKICKWCGKEFTTAKRRSGKYKDFCSDNCRVKFKYQPLKDKPKICVICGKEFIPAHHVTKTCSEECWRANVRRQPSKIKNGYRKEPLTPINCAYCGIKFIPKYSHQKCCCEEHGRKFYGHPEKYSFVCKNCGRQYTTAYRDRNQYCSRECSDSHKIILICEYCGREYFAHAIGQNHQYCSKVCGKKAWKRKNKNVPDATEVSCIICGKVFMQKTWRGKICGSKECISKYASRIHIELDKQNYQPKIFICKECGKEHITQYGDKSDTFCSRKCMNKYSSRVGKATRSARIRGAKEIESFDPKFVFKRDRWHCQLCGTKTPKYLRGTTEDRAPELDHIIPIALGGSHTIANTQCLCRKCNEAKGATIMGQLRLELRIFT